MNSNIVLAANIQSAIAEALDVTKSKRGRGYASTREAWAELKILLERSGEEMKNVTKIHKEMWDAVSSEDDAAAAVYAAELERAATNAAALLSKVAVSAKITCLFPDGAEYSAEGRE